MRYRPQKQNGGYISIQKCLPYFLGYIIMILLSQNSRWLAPSFRCFAAHYTDCHGLQNKCLLPSRLFFGAHGIIMILLLQHIIPKRKVESTMSFTFIEKLPTPDEIRQQYPLPQALAQRKAERDREIRDVLTGKSNKLLVIIGPCSADNEDSVCDYVNRLARINDKVSDKLILIPRIYTNKPRTTGEGYKGIVHQPDPEKQEDFLAGLVAMRKMHIRAIEETGLTAADEMLYPENWGYVSDILSYVAIGARSVEDQQHRLTVSGFDIPAGMKNPTSGDFSVMLNSVYAAQHPHSFIYRGWAVKTNGNDLAHTVLRGATNKHGNNTPNYHYEDLNRLMEMYDKMDLLNPACIIDSNHSNSNKQFAQQIRIVKEVMHSRKLNADIHRLVKGVMVESYIEEGCQKVGGGVYGKSITDPCLGWADTERLIYDLAEYE